MRYRNGAVENIKREKTSILFLPSLSESKPAGMLAIIPVNAETDAIKPTPEGSAPRWVENRGSTGLLDIVELNMANSPVLQSSIKGLNFVAFLPIG